MVAVVAGAGLGLQSGSLAALGAQGLLGTAAFGRGGERVYVNAGNGNLILQHQDEFLAGGLPLGLIRTYNSQGLGGDAGNWRLGYSRQVTGLSGQANAAGSSVRRIAEDGSEILYRYDVPQGRYLAQREIDATDTLQWDGQIWTWTDGASQAQERYDAGGRLQQTRDRDGQTVDVGYDGAGRIVSLKRAGGEALFVDYDAQGQLSQLRTTYQKDGQSQTLTRTRYGYDAQGRLSSVTTDLTPDDNSVADGQVYTTRYVYDGASRRVASLQQSDGSRLDFGYVQVGSDYRIQTVIDVRANGVKLTTRFDYDAGGGRTTVTDAAQQATQLDYADDRLVRVSGGGIEQRYVYDKQGRVSDVTDGRGQATRYEYDATGNRISRDEGRGRKTTWRYGAQNQLLSEATSGGGTARQIHDAGGTHVRFSISAEGRVIERRYDSQGREACRIAYQGGAYLNAGDATREADLVAWAAKQDPKRCERLDTRYDLRGLVSATVRYATLDAKGNGVLDGKESHSRFVYDQAGNLLQKLDGGKGTVLADYVYDGLNRVTRVKDASGDVTTTVYGDASRQTRIALGNGLTTITQYDAEGRELSVLSQDAGGQLGTLRTEYNAAGLPVKLIDANGVASYRIYDALGRKTGEIDAEGALTELRYNAAGQLFFSVRYANRLEAPKLAGSAANWKVEQLRPASDKTNDRMEHRLYDTLGQLTQIIDAEGGVVRHEYDAAGRLLASTRYANRLAADRLAALAQASGELNSDDAANRPVADAANDRVSRQFYDRDGLLLASVDGEGYLTEQKYDSAGHVIEVLRYATRAKAGAALEAIRPAASGDDQRVRQLYDGQGRLLGRVDAEGYLEETVYDARGRLAQTVRYANRAKPGDALDAARPASHAQDRKVVNVYDDADRLQSQTRQPDGLVTRYRYDGQGRLIETTRVAGNDSRSALKRYDSQGRVTQELAGEGAQAIAALGAKATGQQIDAVWSRWGERHYYNAGGQRIATLSPDGQGGAGRRTLYYYDGEGRLSHTLNSLGEVRETRYNVFGEAIDSRRYATRLSAEQLAKLNGGASNVLGNFVSSLKNAADGIETNQYNRLGQRVVAGDSLTAERERWEFNAFGEVSAQQSIGRSEYLYDRAGRETQRISDAKKLALRPRTEYDAFGRAIAVTDAAGRVARSRYDKLGRQIQITDPLGGLRQISYDAFGRELSVRDALGRVTTTVYDDAAGRSTVTHPLGVKTISQRNAHGETVQLIDGLGQTTTYQYNRDGALLSTASAAGVARAVYDSAGQKIEAVSASGVKTIYRYDAAGRQLSSELDPGGLKLVSRTEYDAQGRVWRQTDPSGRVSENRYDANSRLKAVVIDPNGLKLTTAYDYDAHGQKVRVTEAAGRVTEYEYDGAGRRVRETVDPKGLKLTTHYQYDAAGNVVAKTDVGNRVSRFVYDGGNQLRYSVDPLGYVTEQRYDAAGQIVQTLRYAQAIPLDKLAVALKISDLSSRLKPSAGDQISRVVYDDAGRAAFSVDASGYATRRVYDAAGHVVETRRHANRTVVNEVWIQTNQKLYAYLLGRAADSPGVLNDKTAADPAARATALMAGADFEKKAGKLDNPQLIAWIYQTVYNRAGSAGELAAGQARLDKGESRGSVFWSLLQQAEAQEVAPNAAIARALSDWRVLAEGTGYHANDQVTRQQYDAAGRVSLNLDAAGYLTSYRYDAAGSVTETRRYAQRVWPEADAKSSVAANADWADYNKRAYAYVLGRAPANLAELNARAADFSARAQELVSSPEFEKLHGKLDDAKFVDWAYRRIGLRAPSKAETDEWLVNFSQKGLSRGELAKRLLYWRIELKRPASAEIRAAQNDWSVLSQLRASPQDQITRTVYDAAGRAAFSVDAAGYATRRVYDEAGNVVETRRYANRTVSNEGWAQTNQKLYAYLLGRPVDSLGVLNDKTAADPAARATALMAGADFEKKAGKLDNPQLIAWIYQTVYNRAGSAGELAAGQARLDKGESRGSVFWSLLQQAEAQAVAPNAGIARALIDWRALAETSLHVNDQITRQQYDAAGRVSLGLDAAGYLTGYRYDAAGNVTELRRYAQRVWPEPDAKSSAAANADWADYNKKLYAHVLGRAPASLAELNSRSADKIARAQELVASPEFEKLHGKLDDSRFITLIYQRIAGWTPGKNEMDTWLANFAKGDVRGKLVNSLMQWRGVLKRLSPIAAVSSALNDWSVLSQLSASPQDQITRTAYDKAGRVSEMHKGSDGAMARVAKYELDAYGNRVKEWDGNNHLTSREFDALGRVHKETHGEGDATVTDYDTFGNAVKITDPRGNAGYFYFDALGRRILQVDPEGGVTRTDYDAFGNANAVTRYANAVDPAALQIGILPTVAADAKRDAVSRIDYDALGRQTKITDAEGGVESMTYDAFGNKATYTNQLGAVFSYDYDAAGRVLKETGRDGATVLSVKRFEYDAFGNRTLQVEAEGQPEQRRTAYGYDSLNRLVSQTGDAVTIYTLDKGVQNNVRPTETRRYDAVGNLVEFIDANGNVTRTAYDSQNRKVRERNGDGYVTTWAYDGAGNVTEQRVYATPVGLPADGGAPQPADGACRVTKFEYDNNNRLRKTILPNQLIIRGNAQKGGSPEVSEGALVTERRYDVNGNVAKEVDARGNSVHRYYDKAGRKLLEVDAGGYATTWAYNSVGKPVRETRYAAAIGVPADSDTLDVVKARLKTNVQDRISEFDYDRMGRVAEERRLNVAYYQQDDFKGAAKDDPLHQALRTGAVRTQYRYNQMGQVRQKTDAKNGVSDIGYDKLGREIHLEEAAFANQAGQMVRPTTDTAYNGLGQATQVRKAGVDSVFSETHYTTGGRADWSRDAEGNTIRYDYDAVGNISRTRRDRKEAAGGQDVIQYSYTAAKQQTVQLQMLDGQNGLYTETRYNAWGQVTDKRTRSNSQGADSAWQEFSRYDTAGRLVKSNAGGVTKLYGYDANGNVSLTVESGREGGDELRDLTLEQVLYRLSQTKSPSFQADLDAFRLTVSDYDARNQRTATKQPRIVNANQASVAQVEAWTTARPQTGSGDVVTTDGAVFRDPTATSNPLVGGAVSIGTSGGLSGKMSFKIIKSPDALAATLHLAMPDNVGLLGDGRFRIKTISHVEPHRYSRRELNHYASAGRYISTELHWPRKSYGARNYRVEVEVYKEVGGKEVFVGRLDHGFNGWAIFQGMQSGNREIPFPATHFDRKEMYFKGQPQEANRLILLTHATGSAEGWKVHKVPAVFGKDAKTPLWFAKDWSGMARGKYEFRYLAVDANGKVLNAQSGTMLLDDNKPFMSPSSQRVDKAFMYGDNGGWGNGWVNVTGLGDNANRAQVRFRAPGQAWGNRIERSPATSDGALNGWFQFNPADYGLAAGATYEYDLEYFNGTNSLGRVIGSFRPGEAHSLTQPVKWEERPQVVHIKNQLGAAASGKVRYRPSGSKGDFATAALLMGKDRELLWDCADLARGLPKATNYDFEYQIFDANGRMINRAQGAIVLGGGAAKLDAPKVKGLPLPMEASFTPEQGNAAKMELQYRVKGSNAAWRDAVLNRQPGGDFLLNVDALAVGDYEYRYQLLDGQGRYLQDKDGSVLQVIGYLNRGASDQPITSERLRWVLQGVSNAEVTVVRRQAYNAFGEVVSETDGVGNTTRSDYNAAGKLVAKREARLRLRDGDGNALKNADGSDKLGDEAVTRYGYDAMGNLVSTIDANNHENKQRWLAGSQDGQGKVLRERHADGSSKEMGYDQLGNLRTQTVNGQRQQDYAYDKLGRLKRLDRAPGANGKRGYDAYDYDSAGQRIGHRTTSNGSDVLTDTTRYDSLGRVLDTVSAATRHTGYNYVWDAQLKGAGGIVVGGWRMTTTNANQMTMQDATSLFGLKAEHRDLGGRVFQYQYNNAGQLTRQWNANDAKGQNIVYTYYGNGNLQGIEDRVAGQFTLYGYDDDGRKIYEAYANGPSRNSLTFYQQSALRYDERGRVIEIKDPRFLSRYQYDAVGNRQRVYSMYQDGKNGSRQVQDNWYGYDAMNRFTVSMGSRDAAGNIVRGSRGVSVEYDGFGQRAKVTNADGKVETYSYTADGYLTETKINNQRAFLRTNDLLGRTLDAETFSWDGKVKAGKTHTDYDADNKIKRQVVDGKATKYVLMKDGTVEHTEQEDDTSVKTYYQYEWWDEAKQSTITAQPYNKKAPGWQPGISHLTYDVNGHLKEAIDEKGRRSLRYVNDAQGVVIRREEIDKGSVYKKQDYYYVDGKQVGAVGNDGPSRVDFAQALAQITLGNKKDQYRFGQAVSSADFDQSYEPIGPNYPGQAPGSVTAREGDTLQVMAANLWGDRSLWYLLADANGLQGTEALKAGQVLRVPNKVTNFHNNSGTYRVYSPGEAIGDVTPTLPEPPPPPHRKGGCGGGGAIFVAAVAVVAAVFTAGAALSVIAPTLVSGGIMAAGGAALTGGMGMAGLAAAAIGGAVGSIASQGVAMAMGMQDKFSWGQVGLSAFTTVATAGLAGGGGALSGTSVSQTVARTMAVNAVTQGVAMATGMQKSFSWTSVAASGVAAWATSGIKPNVETNPLANIGFGTIRGMAGGAIQSVLGNDHQPNWGNLAANSFGSALGDQVVGSLQTVGRGRLSKAGREVNAIRGMYANSQKVMLESLMGFASDVPSEVGEALGSSQDNEEQAQRAQAGKATGPRPSVRVRDYSGVSSIDEGGAEAMAQGNMVVVTAPPFRASESLNYRNGSGSFVTAADGNNGDTLVYYANGVAIEHADGTRSFEERDNNKLLLSDKAMERVQQRISYLNDKDSWAWGGIKSVLGMPHNTATWAESNELWSLQNMYRFNQLERWDAPERQFATLDAVRNGPIGTLGYFIGSDKGAQLGSIGDNAMGGLVFRSGNMPSVRSAQAEVILSQGISLSVRRSDPYGIRQIVPKNVTVSGEVDFIGPIVPETIVSPEMQQKILWGQRQLRSGGIPSNGFIGAHSGQISNDLPNYAVEVLKSNVDGTSAVRLVTQFADGNVSKIKTSTLFPKDWSDFDVMRSIHEVGRNNNAVATRLLDGSTFYRGQVNGVNIEVIKAGSRVTAAYPAGGNFTPFELLGLTPKP